MIAFDYDNTKQTGDFTLIAAGLLRDDSLRTVVQISLFTDARARSDETPPSGTDRRGWVGDALAENGQGPIGSNWWLFERAKQTEDTRKGMEDGARRALAWLIADGIVQQIEVRSEWVSRGFLRTHVALLRVDGTWERFGFDKLVGGA